MSGRLGSIFLRRDGSVRPALLATGCLLICLVAFALGWRNAGQYAPVPQDAAQGGTTPTPAMASNGPTSPVPPVKAAETGVPWPLWEFQVAQPIPETDPPRTPLPWRLIGASRSAGQWKLIVLRQGKPEPEFFGIGDKLPGGYRIEAISDEDVTLRQGRKTLILAYIGTQ